MASFSCSVDKETIAQKVLDKIGTDYTLPEDFHPIIKSIIVAVISENEVKAAVRAPRKASSKAAAASVAVVAVPVASTVSAPVMVGGGSSVAVSSAPAAVPAAPKVRKTTGYQIFVKEKMPTVMGPQNEKMKTVAEMWGSLGLEGQKPYNEKAVSLNAVIMASVPVA